MRQVLLRFPFDQPWDLGPLGHWPGFGFGIVLLAWVLFGAWSLRYLWRARGHWTGDDWSSIGLWIGIAAAIIFAPQFGPRFAPEGLPIYGYGLMLLISFGSGALLAIWRAQREGLNADLIWDLAAWLFIPGLVGARVFYLVQYGHQVFAGKQGAELLWAVVNLPDGGLVLFGGLLAGAVSYFTFCHLRQVPPLLLADIVTPSVFLGIGFGRIGCLLNGCCFGDVCHLPWGLSFPKDSVPYRVLVDRGFLAPDAPFTPPLHPTQIYSAIDGFLICAITLAYYPYRQRNGSVFGVALLIYPTTRFLIELLRGDEYGQFGTSLTISQWVSIGVILCGIVYNVVLWGLPAQGRPLRAATRTA